MGEILARHELIQRVARDRAAGLSVAFANGCFDLLHVGHIRYLESAASEGDRLIVAINDDESVRRLKGQGQEGRPILAAADRAELVAALRCVDYVVMFPGPTVGPLLQAVKPDVHCKGTDYTLDTVPERDIVKSYGGRIAIVGDPKDHSTRDLLARIGGSTVVSGSSRTGRPDTDTQPRFLIIRLGSLGDVIHGIPAAAALRRRFPQAPIDWLVDPRYAELLELVECIDRPIAFDPRDLRIGGAQGWSVLTQLRAAHYDAVVDLQGLLKSAVLGRLVGATQTIGFPRTHLREPLARLFYTDAPDPGAAPHVIDKNLGLLGPLGVSDRAVHFPLRIPRTDTITSVVDRFAPDGYAILNPGAAWPNKRWPVVRFGAVAASIRREHGLRSVVLWGPGEEALAVSVAAASEGAAEAAPPTTMPDVVGLARAARVMVSGDTGPLHIAGAVGTPLVALFGPTCPERNGPWAPGDVTLSRVANCSCLYERRCRRETPCIDDIVSDEVVQAIRQRLSVHG